MASPIRRYLKRKPVLLVFKIVKRRLVGNGSLTVSVRTVLIETMSQYLMGIHQRRILRYNAVSPNRKSGKERSWQIAPKETKQQVATTNTNAVRFTRSALFTLNAMRVAVAKINMKPEMKTLSNLHLRG